ncbi:hypothetical protein [Chromobacterium sp. ASV23]|uniref:hypothetical protein n=1 Tax=Chromobacterium sp. ASV23 TaxID=2795110 RepID=UPI0018ED794C|nr:hypothetical protein [Chromobacterium sp. ASV23]
MRKPRADMILLATLALSLIGLVQIWSRALHLHALIILMLAIACTMFYGAARTTREGVFHSARFKTAISRADHPFRFRVHIATILTIGFGALYIGVRLLLAIS